MADWKSVPLGVDLGATRVRLAYGRIDRTGTIRVDAVVSRDLPDGGWAKSDADLKLVAAVAEDAWSELRVRERRCILAVGPPAAAVRYVALPPMSWAERLRAARFDVARWPGWDTAIDPIVRVHSVEHRNGIYAIGAVRREVLDRRLAVLRAAGLRPVAVDHESLALHRALGASTAIVDVSAERTSVHVYGEAGPLCAVSALAGAEITRGIAQELAIDLESAERRKRILGCAGAGAGARDAVVASIASLLERFRARAVIDRIAVTGNGARLPNFAESLRDATGVAAEMPVPKLLEGEAYPSDVIRTAAPDWSLAVGLLAWSTAS